MTLGFRLALTCALAVLLPLGAMASSSKEARITQIVKDVRLAAGQETARAAAVNDAVGEGATIKTGNESRAELTFADRSIARVSANSVFSFKDNRWNLGEGSVLVQVPRHLKSTRIEIPGVGAVVSGTTAVFEFHSTVYKFLVLQGVGRLYRPGHLGQSVLVRPGQMVIGQPNAALSEPVDFDLGRFVKTCRLLKDFPTLNTQPLLAREAQRQEKEKGKKRLIDTNLVIFGAGTAVSLTNPNATAAANQPPATDNAPTPPPAQAAMPRVDQTTDIRR
jgi:hypothetical protein